jgi:hypothetical protein
MAEITRRGLLIGGVAALPATTLPSVAISILKTDTLLNNPKGGDSMATITTKDGTTIFYKDWGPKDAQPIVLHHGWPLSSDDWDAQMLFFMPMAIASLRMTDAVTDALRRWALATTWTITRPTPLRWSSIST